MLPLSALRLSAQGVTSGIIGLVIALHALGLIFAVVLCEPAVRRLGARRTVELFGVSAAFACFLLQQFAAVWALSLGLFTVGVLLGVVLNMVETWVNEVVPEAQRGQWLAIHCTVFTLFQLGGPLLLEHIPTEHGFEVCALLMLCAWPVYRKLSKRILGEEEHLGDAGFKPWWQKLLSAPVITSSTALFALFDTVVLSLLPLYAIAQGLSQQEALASASVVLAGDTALEIVIGALADKFGRERVHTACAVVLLVTAVLTPLAVGTGYWWPLLFVMGGAAGGIYVLSMMACGQRFSGARLLRMTSLLGSVWGAASIVGPLATGLLMELHPVASLPVVLATSAGLLLLSLAYEKRKNISKIESISHVECI
jgi:MFS family permease